MSNDKLAEALRSLRLKFTSGNDMPVPEARITRAEWEAIEQAHAAEAAQPMTPRELAARVARGEKWEPAAEAAQIGADPALSVGGCESVDRNKQMQAAEPFVYAYVYPDGTRFDTGGRELNGSRPTKAIPLYTHPQPAQDAKLPSDEDFRLHLGELTPAELRVAQAAARYVLAGTDARAPDFTDVSFEVWQNDEMVASCSGPEPQALTEAMHYASQYAQDGPVSVFRVSRVRIDTAKESGR